MHLKDQFIVNYMNRKKVALFGERVAAQISHRSNVLACLLLVVPTLCHSEQSDRNGGSWDDLSSLVGTYDIQALLGDDRVERVLKGLNADDLETLFERIDVTGPIGFDGDCLMVRGNMVRKGESDLGQIFVCTRTQEIHAATFSSTDLMIFTNDLSYDHLPYDFRLWIDANRLRLGLPQANENHLTAFQNR